METAVNNPEVKKLVYTLTKRDTGVFIKSEYASITVQALMDMAKDLTKRTKTGHFGGMEPRYTRAFH